MLVEVMAQELVAHGITPGTPNFESFVKMQVGALIERTNGICAELGEEIEIEEPAPARSG